MHQQLTISHSVLYSIRPVTTSDELCRHDIRIKRSTQGLQLTWPQSIHYHSGFFDPIVQTSANVSVVATPPQPSSQCQRFDTYNGARLDGSVGQYLDREQVRHVVGDEIRLLDLKPGKADTPLRGVLRKVSLSEYREYACEPLSYTWEDHPTDTSSRDDPDVDMHLVDNTGHTYGYIALQTNCAKALYRIRHDEDQHARVENLRTIWVDAICINQDDMEEKKQQVAMMHRIYARRHTVIAYISHKSAEHGSCTAVSLLRHPSSLSADALSTHHLSILDNLVRRPYFQRMWIVQECLLAESLTLICGPDEVTISEFTKTLLELLLNLKDLVQVPAWLQHSLQMRRTEERGTSASLRASTAVASPNP